MKQATKKALATVEQKLAKFAASVQTMDRTDAQLDHLYQAKALQGVVDAKEEAYETACDAVATAGEAAGAALTKLVSLVVRDALRKAGVKKLSDAVDELDMYASITLR